MTAINIDYWQQSNPFTITLRGHHQDIPFPDQGILKSDFDPILYKQQQSGLNSLINQMTGSNNYNKIYDSFFAPTDFKFSAITMRLPSPLPERTEIKVSFRVNGGEIELLPIPELQSYNQMIYGTDCDLHIWEDDYIEITVDFGDESIWQELKWNDNNMIVGIAGCIWYEEYESIFPGGQKSWELGDSYFKTNITLQNRSGNDLLTDRIFADIVRSPVSFLIQGLRLSMFEDELMTDDKLPRIGSCFFVDVLVNGRSVNAALGIERPVAIDSINNSLRVFNSPSYDNVSGYPVVVGDDILIKIYQKNPTAKYNGKIIQVHLFGCASDCVTLVGEAVSVYELCATTPCEAKFTVEQNCDPNRLLTAPNKQNPTLNIN